MVLFLAALLLANGGCGQATRAAAVAHLRVRAARAAELPLEERRAACWKLCSRYGGQGSEQRTCLADCHVRTDLATGHAEEELRDFAGDALGAREQGEMCKPLVSVRNIGFKDVDLDDNNTIMPSELETIGSLLCIPRNLVKRLFADMDPNSDGQITYLEWRQAGEDTAYEYEVDKVADKARKVKPPSIEDEASQAMKELIAETKAPDFQALDADGNGLLDDWEILSGFMRELLNRDPHMPLELRKYMKDMFLSSIQQIIEVLDTDGDGFIGPVEYQILKDGQDLGDEMQEVSAGVNAKVQEEPVGVRAAPQEAAGHAGEEREAVQLFVHLLNKLAQPAELKGARQPSGLPVRPV